MISEEKSYKNKKENRRKKSLKLLKLIGKQIINMYFCSTQVK